MEGVMKPESGEEVTVEEQIEQIGFGRFQMIAVVAFVCFIVADGMELVVTNITWSVLPRDEWGASDYARGVLVSVSFFGFVLGALIGGFTGNLASSSLLRSLLRSLWSSLMCSRWPTLFIVWCAQRRCTK